VTSQAIEREQQAAAVRYGVFLRPDPQTCAAVTTITGPVRAQYGLVSAAAFPPHATLAGSLALKGEPEQAATLVCDALGPVLNATAPFPVANQGVQMLGPSVVYDINLLDGVPNARLVQLAEQVSTVVRPLLRATPPGQLASDVLPPERWYGHLSLASHELHARVDLREEVREFIAALDVPVPAQFSGDTVAVYRLSNPSWGDGWWRTLQWDHVRTWRLGSQS